MRDRLIVEKIKFERPKPYQPGDVIELPNFPRKVLYADPNLSERVLKEIHRQIDLILHKTALKPKILAVGLGIYENLLMYEYIRTGSKSLDEVYGLQVIASSLIDPYFFRVQCSSWNELIYSEELEKLRYGG